jgi:diguanylate cyclase (GGDEF)-like protein
VGDFPLLSVLYTGAALVAVSAGVGALRRRSSSPAATPLVLVMAGLAWWSTAAAVETVLPDGVARVALLYGLFFGVSLVVAGFYCEARVLVDAGWRPARRTIALLCIEPLLLQITILTDPVHHLLIHQLLPGRTRWWLSWTPGPLFHLHTGYCYLVLGWCLIHLGRAMRSAGSPLERRQLRSILLAALIPTGANLVVVITGCHAMGPDLTACAFVVTGLIHYYAVFRQGLLRLLPVARAVVLEHVSDAIFVMDAAGILLDVNPAGVRLARALDPDLPPALVGLPTRRLVPHSKGRRILTDGQHHVKRADGAMDLDLRISELSDADGRLLGRVVVVRDVTELNTQRRELATVNGQLVQQLETIDRLRHELAEQAVRDDLTGLHNRRHLLAQLELELARARSDDTWLSAVLLDIDHFKSVNDTFGHAVGDDLLAATARALSASLRAGDTVARYGGEEFVILLPGTPYGDALRTAEALRRQCATVLVDSRYGPVSTTVSAGVATFPVCGWTGGELLQAADEALYAAKAAGRDRVVGADV